MTGSAGRPLNPQHILQVGMAFFAAKTLLSAVELALFTRLGDAAMTAEELRRALDLHPRAVPDFPDALVALGLLARDGDGAQARYRNTPETAAFLDKTKPGYIGGILEMANSRLYPFWADLTEGLKTGQQQNEVKRSGRPLFDILYADPARLEQFLQAMAGISKGNFRALADKFDFSGYETLVDIGGAMGELAIAVAECHPHMRCISADLPVVEPIAERRIAQSAAKDRIDTLALDFFTDDFPPADVITMSLILHDWGLDRKRQLIAKAYDALSPGGAYIVIENMIDDARRSNVYGLMMSLNMLIECGEGFDFTGADFTRWCEDAGFSQVRILPLGGPASAGIAIK